MKTWCEKQKQNSMGGVSTVIITVIFWQLPFFIHLFNFNFQEEFVDYKQWQLTVEGTNINR